MSNDNLMITPLNEEHQKLGAKMVPFSGWNMPVQYSEGIIAEHKHTRKDASIFDICHMGEFRVSGEGVAEELDGILARSVRDQKSGTCRYNFLLTAEGTVIDDLLVYKINDYDFFLVVNAGTKDNDAKIIKERLSGLVTFSDESEITAKIDLQGPKSADVLEKLGFNKAELPSYYKWIKSEIASTKCLLSRTGYTGELGYELYVSVDKATEIWNLLLENEDVRPAGLGARDTLRLEMGYPLYGHEMDEESTPVEAGFGAMLKLDSGRTFVGSEIIAKSEYKPKKFLVGIELAGRRAARAGTAVAIDGINVGVVSSGAFSPSLNKSIALAYITTAEKPTVGVEVTLQVGRAVLDGIITDLPFYKNGTVRVKL